MDIFDLCNARVGGEKLEARVTLDETLIDLAQACDYSFSGVSEFQVPSMIPPQNYSLGLIVGGSGTGKSSLLKHFGGVSNHTWDSSKAVASQVEPQALMRLGLSSIPSLCRPYHILSEGEKHRADIARALTLGVSVIDEFTSTVHRDLARTICIGLRRWVDKNKGQRLVLATCHEDVAEWLEPDWVFNTNTGLLVEGRSERRPLKLEIYPCSVKAWSTFSNHHYLTGKINAGARCWLGVIDNKPVAFGSALALPHPTIKKAWREHRTVVLPDYQGMGLGSKLSNYIASLFLNEGCRYFSKTAHPAFGEYREASPLWVATSKNKMSRQDYLKAEGDVKYSAELRRKNAGRFCYSHEFVGAPPN